MPSIPASLKRAAAISAIGGTAILLAGLAVGSSAAPNATTASASPCQTPGLVIWLDTQGNGAAGSIYYKLRFTNLSAHACTLNGFPFINGVSLTGGLLGKRAGFDHSSAPHTVTINKGHTATATLRIVEAGNFPASSCKPTTAAGLRVFPPNQQRSKTVPFPFAACSASNGPVYLSVSPVTG